MGVGNIITFHPFKLVWGLFAVFSGAVQFPFWTILYSSASRRQHPNWTFKQALKTRILRTALWHFSFTHVYTPLKLRSSWKEGDAHITISPSSKKIYTGILEDKEVKPATIPAHWYPSAWDPKADQGKKVVLHFHGGAYVIGTHNDREAQFGGSTYAKTVGKSLWIGYRLSSNTGGRFPAALQDAVSAYQFLLDKGIPAPDIVVGGDSAGGNLALALLRYCATGALPSPGAALLWSPWVDVAAGLDEKMMTTSPHYPSDYLCPGFGYWGASTYAPTNGPVPVTSEWISPKTHPFKTATPIWVQACGQEVLFHDIQEFYEGMKNIKGNKVSWRLDPFSNHDLILVGLGTGFEKEAQDAASQAGKWLEKISSGNTQGLFD